MNYHIVWAPKAEQHLAAAWLAATDRPAVNRAADEIDRVLAKRPLEVGE